MVFRSTGAQKQQHSAEMKGAGLPEPFCCCMWLQGDPLDEMSHPLLGDQPTLKLMADQDEVQGFGASSSARPSRVPRQPNWFLQLIGGSFSVLDCHALHRVQQDPLSPCLFAPCPMCPVSQAGLFRTFFFTVRRLSPHADQPNHDFCVKCSSRQKHFYLASKKLQRLCM